MTVKQLIAQLKKQDGRRIVVISRDAEGNSFSPLHEVSAAAYRSYSTYSGLIGLEADDLDDATRNAGYSEEDVIEDGVPSLVLCPMN